MISLTTSAEEPPTYSSSAMILKPTAASVQKTLLERCSPLILNNPIFKLEGEILLHEGCTPRQFLEFMKRVQEHEKNNIQEKNKHIFIDKEIEKLKEKNRPILAEMEIDKLREKNKPILAQKKIEKIREENKPVLAQKEIDKLILLNEIASVNYSTRCYKD